MRLKSYIMNITKSLSPAVFTLAVLLAVSGAHAVPRPVEQVRAEFEQSFQTMIANPADAKATLRYAHLAVELKDYESAIPPLERLLMLNPDLPQVRLEVGIMYYNLKSHDMARTYLTHVKNDPAAAGALKTKAEQYLAKL